MSCDLRTSKEIFEFPHADCRLKEIWETHEIPQNSIFYESLSQLFLKF